MGKLSRHFWLLYHFELSVYIINVKCNVMMPSDYLWHTHSHVITGILNEDLCRPNQTPSLIPRLLFLG